MSTEPLQTGSMGLGAFKMIGNTTAMVVVVAAFLLQLFWAERSAREDRELCREQLAQVRHDFAEFRQENKAELSAIRRALVVLRKDREP